MLLALEVTSRVPSRSPGSVDWAGHGGDCLLGLKSIFQRLLTIHNSFDAFV